MALNILCSSRTEVLVQHLVLALGAPGDPGLVRPVLLPSRPLVEKVGLALAREQGVAMGVDFLLPGAFFDRVAGALGLEPLDPAWQPEGLFWRLLPLVRAAAESPGSRLAAARGEEIALVSLTRQIADRFDQYLHYRPALIQAWDLGQGWDELPDDARADEAWQRELWKGLKRPLAHGRALPPHLVERFETLKARLAQSKAAPFGQALEVLSTGPLPGGMLDVLAVLGRGCDVNLRMLMPSREYLRHIKSVAQQRRAGEDASLDREGHPLLASLGRQAVDSFGVLDDLLDREGGDFTVLDGEQGLPETDAAASLLGTLQGDIRAARQPDPALRPPAQGSPDRSLRVHRCHGPRREVEILRDELTRAFEDLEGLRAEEVLILSPDLQAHAPLAQALLPASGYGLPLGLSESGVTLEDPLLRALTALLRFAAGRAALSEGLGLLDLDASVRVLGEEEARALASRLEGAGLSFGLDAAHRADLGAGNEAAGTWRFSLDRLLQGLWLGEEENAESPDRAACLPQAGALSSGRGEALDALRWADTLVSTARLWRSEKQGPQGWADRLRQATDALFRHPDTPEEALAGVLDWLRRAGEDLGCETALGPGALADHLDAFARDEERAVRAVGGRMALGGLKPLRALPCRVLALLGLSDAAFPRRDDAPAWDLMAAKHLIGDRDPREEDRQLFLDALLSAKDRVIITAPARHSVTDKPVPFSVCVDELLRCALATGAASPDKREALLKTLVLDHPSQPFTPSNFGAGGSFDRANHALAEAVLQDRAPRPFAAPDAEARPREPANFNSTAELLRFFKDPARAWAGALGLRLPQDVEGPAQGDDEPLDLEDALRRWQLTQALLERGGQDIQTGPSLRRRVERLAADRLLPYGALGQALAADSWDALRGPVQILRDRAGGWDWVEAEALLPESFQGALCLARKGSILIHQSASAWDSPRLGLELHLQACLASASGRPLPTLALARAGGGSSAKYVAREIPSPPKAQAEDRLRFLKGLAQSGLVRALCFDPDISLALAELEEGEGMDWGQAFPKSHSLSLALLSRDRDPFEGEGWTRWRREASAVYGPILAWLAQAREAGHA